MKKICCNSFQQSYVEKTHRNHSNITRSSDQIIKNTWKKYCCTIYLMKMKKKLLKKKTTSKLYFARDIFIWFFSSKCSINCWSTNLRDFPDRGISATSLFFTPTQIKTAMKISSIFKTGSTLKCRFALDLILPH